jgi:hypothetical protein
MHTRMMNITSMHMISYGMTRNHIAISTYMRPRSIHIGISRMSIIGTGIEHEIHACPRFRYTVGILLLGTAAPKSQKTTWC